AVRAGAAGADGGAGGGAGRGGVAGAGQHGADGGAAAGRGGAAEGAAGAGGGGAVGGPGGVVACGTRAVLGAGCGPVRGKGSGEQDLARGLLGSLGPGMLLLADRNFCSYALWNAAAGTGADLLWRAKASMHLPVMRVSEILCGGW